MKQLRITNLSAKIGQKPVLNHINLTVNAGETVLILGPNGHGKSTLFKTIFHHYSTEITEGQIFIDGEDTATWTTDQIARAGIYLAMQHPVEIPGLKLLDLLRSELGAEGRTSTMQLYRILNDKMRGLQMDPQLLSRSINENFSGGERKKNEILQMEVINPDFVLLDEIDSGLDTDAINAISNVFKQQKKTVIYISHNDKLSFNLIPDRVVVMMNGEIVREGGVELANRIQAEGYGWLGITEQMNHDLEQDELFEQIKGFNCAQGH